ncbi:MAG TPA: BlaI/MecI/CopY family transcriptional regulator [Mycobacteriales bacterium]|nr:BlaI/MecI/CopY family transcriptional regulator [Mycobacteriales bacterium]
MRRFGELEAAIMECLWARSQPASVRDVLGELHTGKQLAYTTVLTVLDNLHRKGVVTREMSGRAWLYQPAYSREEHTAMMLREVLGTSGDRQAALMHFVAELDTDAVADLTAAVKAAKKRARS